jgi:hypothetical protein
MQTVTAGWAAAFIAAYSQIRAARSADRRLVLAGLPAGAARRRPGGHRPGAGGGSFRSRGGHAGGPQRIAHPARVLAGTFMFAVIYLATGALVGTLVASPVNGTVLIFFVWITDVMFGPVFGPRPARRAGCSRPTSSPCG